MGRFCVIGAGPCGLAATKVLRSSGLDVDCFERKSDVGGTWNRDGDSVVYDSATMISSKRLTEFSDFRMPREYPHYPNHQQVIAYLRDYTEQFELYPHMRFGSAVADVQPIGDS